MTIGELIQDQKLRNYIFNDVRLMMDVMGIMVEERKAKHNWKQYFRIEPFKRQGKGTVYRLVRIRDEHIILRLVKSERKAVESAMKMLDQEVAIVERIVERTILG